MRTGKKTRRLTVSALLVTVMLMLGYLENFVPTGVPGIKLGLSNSVLLLAIYWLGIPTALILMVVKVVLSGILFSGVSAMMYAFAGGVLSMVQGKRVFSHCNRDGGCGFPQCWAGWACHGYSGNGSAGLLYGYSDAGRACDGICNRYRNITADETSPGKHETGELEPIMQS